jgi:hypothetical protein
MQSGERRVDLSEREGAGTGEVLVVAVLELVPVLRTLFEETQERVPE